MYPLASIVSPSPLLTNSSVSYFRSSKAAPSATAVYTPRPSSISSSRPVDPPPISLTGKPSQTHTLTPNSQKPRQSPSFVAPQSTPYSIFPFTSDFDDVDYDSDDDSDDEPPSSIACRRKVSSAHRLRIRQFQLLSFQERPSMSRTRQSPRVHPPSRVNVTQDDETTYSHFHQGDDRNDENDDDDDMHDSSQGSDFDDDEYYQSGDEYVPSSSARSDPIPIPGAEARTHSYVNGMLTHSLNNNVVRDLHPELYLPFLPAAVRQRAFTSQSDISNSSTLVVGSPERTRHSNEFDERIFY